MFCPQERSPGDAEVTAIERLGRELENLLLSADHLKDIPEVGRHAPSPGLFLL